MKKSKKIIALFLVLVMCIGLFPVLAMADEEQSTKKEFNVAVFGSRTATGYGLSDYGQATRDGKWSDLFYSGNGCSFGVMDNASASSYVNLIRDYIDTALLFQRDVKVKNLCFEGMRADELRALLEPGYMNLVDAKGDTFLKKNINSYTKWFNDKTNAENLGYMSIEKYTEASIKEADVIILDFAMENFYSYLSERIQAIFGLGGYDINDYSEKASDLEAQLDLDIKDIEAIVKDLVKNYVPTSTGISEEKIEAVVEALAYCYSDFRVNFAKDIQLIRSLNSSAKIIVVGAYNIMSGLRLNFKDSLIDMSPMWISMMSLVNNYITGGCEYSKLYFYAGVASGMNTFFQELSMAESVGDVNSEYAYKLAEQAMNLKNLSGTTYVSTAKKIEALRAKKAVMEKNEAYNTDEYRNICNEIDLYDSVLFRESEKQAKTAVSSYMKAAQIPTIDASGALDILSKGSVATAKAIVNAAFNWDKATDAEKALLHLNARFIIGNGVGSCPSESGCKKAYEAVKSAYIKVLPANTDSESTIIGAAGGAFSAILQIFKTPILQTISDLFQNFSISNFFTALRERVSDWVITIFPRG